MGAKESKQSCISYEDAIKRVSESELRRLKDAFKKSAGVGRLYLSRNAFQQDVLCEGVPPNITDLLYNACGGTSKGISFKDLVCGLVLLTRGTEYEKTKFLWNLYCNDGGTYIIKADYLKAIDLHPSEKISLFAQSDRVNFEHFSEWIIKHKNLTVLSKWLLSDSCISLTSELETPTFYQSLAGVTHLEEKDISDLEKEFWRLKNASPNAQLDLQLLGPLISPPIPKNALTGLFNAFDENRDGHIDFKELCCGVSAACRGPEVERTRFCFKIFDIDRDGILNNEETLQMLSVLMFVAKESRNEHLYKDLSRQHAISDLLQFVAQKRKQNANGKEIAEVDTICSNTLTQDNLSLTAEDFMMWSVESSLKLVEPFLDLTFEVCHIVFGLWPQCKHMEYDIVRGWLKREEKRKYRVGQFWYLVSRDWWVAWMQYAQINVSVCEYCKNLSPSRIVHGGVDEALVCDESFNSSSIDASPDLGTTADNCSLGSSSSGISTGRQWGQRPGPIDNINLITPNPFKNVRTLTGEGGHLKRDTPLVQGHDFELIPKSLWKALNRWYGDNLPLPRQVIQQPNSSDVELELYPLNLRILLHQSVSNTPTLNSWGAVSGGYGVIASGGGYAAISATSVPPLPKRYLAYTSAFSHLATVRQIGEFLCDQLRLKAEDIRLWHVPATSVENSAILLEEDNMTLKDLQIKNNEQLLLEIRNKDLTWPEELGSLTLSQSNAAGDRRLTRSSILSVHAPGATGLHNLGNTCFMNAALQVLFNTQPLAQYFCRNMHLFELNTTNKLGTRGQLATRYGELLKEVWTASQRSVAPLKLRFCVNKNAPQFAGGGQHDSQELLEWFLDALHEDLNRVVEWPYNELKDSNGRPDKIVAAEAWSQHHARNQSIVIDLFYGQLKSKVKCLCCGRESVRFDPFSLLSLPLPVENYVYFEVMVILLDGSVPIKYGLRLNTEAKYFDLKQKLAQLCLLNQNFMLVCEVWNSQIRQILNNEQKIKSSSAKELLVYQLPEEFNDSSTLGINIEKGLKDIQRSSALISGQDSLTSLNTQTANQVHTSYNHVKSTPSMNGTEQTNDSNEHSLPNTEDDEDNDDEQAATKQSPELSRSPENTFVNRSAKRISSVKLLNTPSVEANSSIVMRTIDPLRDDEPPIEECPCKYITNDNGNTYLNGKGDIESCTESHAPYNQAVTVDMELKPGEESGDESNGIFSRMPSKHYRAGKYLIAVHRKITRQDSYFLSYHKTHPSLFGVPLLIPNSDGGTHKDLYCAVWLQVNRLLSPLPASTDQAANHAADCDDSLGYDFPFTLRAVKSDGLSCALCPWSNFCRGCEIPCNNDFLLDHLVPGSSYTSKSSTPTMPSKFGTLPNLETKLHLEKSPIVSLDNNSFKFLDDFTIAIDWDPTALHLRYQSTLERLWSEHESIAICRKEQFEPVDLNHCLKAFTSEEKLEQWYHCGHCKGKKPATKKLQIWKLPPILIVHLKRFNCVNGKWVKSKKVVHFPFDDFDPTPYLASVPQATILRHKELLSLKEIDEAFEEDSEVQANDISPKENCNTNINNNNCENECNTLEQDNCYNEPNLSKNYSEISPDRPTIVPDNMSRINKHSKVKKRERLVSTSLTKTPVVDGEFEDYHQHKLKSGEDKFDPKYKLYAVVSHSGMLNGGHYISYAANQNGSWYCYNDSSCREISNEPNIDPSSAYLLFYERRGLDYEPYLPNIEGKELTNGGTGLEVDESDNDLKKLCSLS